MASSVGLKRISASPLPATTVDKRQKSENGEVAVRVTDETEREKADKLFLREFYRAVSAIDGIHLIIDAYVMGPVENLLYSTKRYSLYRMYNQRDHKTIPLRPDLSTAILITANARVKPPDPNVFLASDADKGYVSLDTGDIVPGHEYRYGRGPYEQMLMFVDTEKNRCIGCTWPPDYDLDGAHPDDEHNDGPNAHGLYDARHMIFARFTQRALTFKGQTLTRLSMNMHSQRIIGDFDIVNPPKSSTKQL